MTTKTVIWCLGVILFLVVLHSMFGARIDLLNLDRERTPAAIFSALQFIASGYALCTIFFLSETRSKKILWASLGITFVLLGLDEVSELHENVAYYLVEYVSPFSFFHSGTPMWIIFLSPLIVAVCIILAIAMREIRTCSRAAGRTLVWACMLVGVALALEFLGGVSTLDAFFPFFVIFEESAELVAGTFFLWGFSVYAKERVIESFKKI